MTTDPHDEHGEILRRALHAEAETVIPAPDGLERIRDRIDERPRRKFGRDWFTVTWGRPVLAVTVAVVVAGIGVTAPQTIDLIQSSTGSGASGDNGRHGGTEDTPPGPQGVPPGTQPSDSSAPSDSGAPTAPGSPSLTTSSGSVACAPPPPGSGNGGSATPDPSGSPRGGPTSQPCSSQTPSTSASPSPSDTGPTDPTPTGPTDPPASEDQPETVQSENSTAG